MQTHEIHLPPQTRYDWDFQHRLESALRLVDDEGVVPSLTVDGQDIDLDDEGVV